jgi:para-nitrobenzyl esterase
VLAISPADASASVDQARAAAARIADAVGSPLTRAGLEAVPELACFHARDAALEPAADVLTGFITRNAQPLALGPVVDGEVCEMSVTDALAAGVGASKPLFIGTCAHEFNDLTEGLELAIGSTPARELLVRAGVPADLARDLAADALPSTPQGRSPAAWALGQAMSDAIFRQVVAHWAPVRAASGGPTWVYDFHWGSLAQGVNGAAHCVDVPFGFDILTAPRVDAATGPAPQLLADAVHGDWLAMVRDGSLEAPQWGDGREVIIYGADAARTIGTGYTREARLWEATRS